MDIFEIIRNLITNKSCGWINDVEDKDIKPHVLQVWFLTDFNYRKEVRWLDKFTYKIPPKMFLTLMWSVLPKTPKAPYLRFIHKIKEDTDYDFLFEKIRRQYKISNSEFKVVKSSLLKDIKNNTAQWFTYYGINQVHWKKHKLDFNQMKTLGTQRTIIKHPTGLGKWI